MVLSCLVVVVVAIVSIVLLRKFGYLTWFARSRTKTTGGGLAPHAGASSSYVLLKEGGTDAL